MTADYLLFFFNDSECISFTISFLNRLRHKRSATIPEDGVSRLCLSHIHCPCDSSNRTDII